jgi:hypothetical protein
MVGLAGRLLGAWRDALASLPDAGIVALRPSLVVTDSDVADAHSRTTDQYGPRASIASPAHATVRVALDPRSDPNRYESYLSVEPPLSWPGSAGEHIAEACRVLFGLSPSDVRHDA